LFAFEVTFFHSLLFIMFVSCLQSDYVITDTLIIVTYLLMDMVTSVCLCILCQVFVKKGDVESKMLSALLTGVNRAYPYAKGLSASAMFNLL